MHKQCLAKPLKPQYGGGIIRNPEFNAGLRGWSNFGFSTDATRASASGNTFAVVRGRRKPYQSVSQKVYICRDIAFALCSSLGTDQQGKRSHRSCIQDGQRWICSCRLGRSQIRLLVDAERRAHCKDFRPSRTGANISIQQTRSGFPFGSSTNENIINNAAYQNYFASRFTVTTFENEMKWYDTEYTPGKEDYSKADAMLAFTKKHNIPVRAHNIFWDDPKYQMGWVNSLNRTQLWDATWKRINSIMSRYKGQVIAWDVVNENLHFSYFEDKLGSKASKVFYQEAHKLDANTLMFLNDYNTLEEPQDWVASPSRYLQKLKEIQSYPGNRANMAIGLESHFGVPNIPFMRSALDALANAKVPIWLTEVDAGCPRDRNVDGLASRTV